MEYSDNYSQVTQIAYENLSNQVVMQAVVDYIKYTIKLWKIENHLILDERTPGFYKGELKQIRKFIFSEWFRVLCEIDPETMWNHLQNATKKELDAVKERVRKKAEKEAAKNDNGEGQKDRPEEEECDTEKNVLNIRRSRASAKQCKCRK